MPSRLSLLELRHNGLRGDSGPHVQRQGRDGGDSVRDSYQNPRITRSSYQTTGKFFRSGSVTIPDYGVVQGTVGDRAMSMKPDTNKHQRRIACQRGASLVEYTLLLGIVASVGIGAIRTIGGGLADSSDPCNPGFFVKTAQILGQAEAVRLVCEPPRE